MTYTDETLAKAWLAGEHARDCYVSNLFEAGNRTPEALADAIDDNAGRAAAMRAALAALSVRGEAKYGSPAIIEAETPTGLHRIY